MEVSPPQASGTEDKVGFLQCPVGRTPQGPPVDMATKVPHRHHSPSETATRLEVIRPAVAAVYSLEGEAAAAVEVIRTTLRVLMAMGRLTLHRNRRGLVTRYSTATSA